MLNNGLGKVTLEQCTLRGSKFLSFCQMQEKSYSMEDIRKICAKTEGANGDFRSSFGKHGQVMAIKIPRESIKAETLAVIDSC